MAFTDYLDLRTAVVEQIGSAAFVDVFDRLTKLAEARLNRDLRTRHQITEWPLTVSNGAGVIPDDIAEVIGVYDGAGRELIARSPQARRGTGRGFSLDSWMLRAPDGEYTLEYYAKLPTLTRGVAQSNWLLEQYPDAYLYAVSAEVAKHQRDMDSAQAYMAMADQIMREVRTQDASERYARARVRFAGVVP